MLQRLALLLALGLAVAGSLRAWEYPFAPSGKGVDFHAGTEVRDPYQWLEATDTPETRAWIQAQNALSASFLSTLPRRQELRDRLSRLASMERVGLPQKAGGRYFYQHSNAPGLPAALYARDSVDGMPRLVLDPGRVTAENGAPPSSVVVSPDGKRLVYATAAAGSDWSQYRILNVDTLEEEADRVEGVKFSHVAWTADGQGFFYSRYPLAPALSDSTRIFGSLENHRLYYHRVGTPQRRDPLICEYKADARCFVRGRTSQDGRFLIVLINRGTSPETLVQCADLGDPAQPNVSATLAPLVTRFDSTFEFVGNVGDNLYFRSTWGAPRGCVLSVSYSGGAFGAWRTVVPEGADTIESAALVGGRLVVTLLRNAAGRVRLYTPDGIPAGMLDLPDNCTVTGLVGEWGDKELLVGYTDFTSPGRNMRYDFEANQLFPLFTLSEVLDTSRYVTEQVFYASRDGTRIPMFVTRRRDVPLDGSAPAWLYGYGGFGVSIKPSFSVATMVWLEQGGIHAVPSLRGGGEFGQAWHRAGMRENRRLVVDDYIAAAEFLVSRKYTSPSRLVAAGESNGGLLVAAAVNRRPDLFRVALPSVGVYDLLRYHRFTIGYAWSAEYGTSDDPKAFPYLRTLSPLHNIRPGAAYPAMLVSTGDSDDRVHPSHSYKYVATLQSQVSNTAGDLPVFLSVGERTGHGGSRTATQQLDDDADRLAFALHFVARDAAP